jgi:hypothetical protein
VAVTRVCTVCARPDRQAIDKALVAKQPYRRIAARHGVTTGALQRHAAEHLLAEIVDAWQAERHRNGLELADELRAWMDTLTKLLNACDDWLTDPDDPTRYDLSPRAHEVLVHYEVPREGQRPQRKKGRLADLIARIDGHQSIGDVTLIEHKSADPRKLIIDTSKALEGHLRVLGELVGKLQTQGTTNFLISPEWGELRSRMLAALAPFPDAQLALAESLETQEG